MFSSTRRPVSLRHLRLALAAAVIVCLAAPIAAGAATTRYASPAGAGPAPCLKTAPCSINTAVSVLAGLATGDTVLLAPGTYTPTASVEVSPAITIAGEPGQPPPLIEATGNFGLYLQQGSFAHDIRIDSPSGTTIGFIAELGSVGERIESTGEANDACALGEATLRDSLCESVVTAGGGTGLFAFISSPAPITQVANLLNVTVIGGSEGIVAAANEAATVELHATNTIASGGVFDVAVRSFATTAPVEVTLSHSNFEKIDLEGSEASITAPTEDGNQEAAPVFVDEAAGDYREAEGSPTRLAGDLAAVLPGELDLTGSSRTTNCAGTVGVDIGAYQYECPPPETPVVTPGGDDGGSGPPTTTVGTPTLTTNPPPPPAVPDKPALSRLKLKPARFTVTGKAPKGTTISFTLSAAATVKLEVLGKKTVKGKKTTVTLGTLASVPGASGAGSVKFSGKVKGKPLAPGSYTLRATATAAGGSSAPATTTFTVLAATA
jgi:hypothetical protein